MSLFDFFRRKKSKPDPVQESAPAFENEPAYEPKPVEPAPSPAPALTAETPIPTPAEEPAYEPETVTEQSALVYEPYYTPAEEAEEPAPIEEPVHEPEPAVVSVTTKQEIIREDAPETPVTESVEQITEEVKGDTKIIRKIVVVPEDRLVNVRYDKSFTAKLMQTSDENKAYYNELKNELTAYKKVHSRISWKQYTFRKGIISYAKIAVRGKTLCLYLALDPAKYENSKYIVEDVSDVKKNEETPCLYRIKNARRLKYAKELIAEVFNGIAEKKEKEFVDYAADYPFEEDEPLLERGLIKLLKVRKNIFEEETTLKDGALEIEVPREVTVATAEELMNDEVAEILVRESESESLHGKQTIVNVDTLNEYFEEGEYVTLDKMRERIPFLNKKANVIKVLARGSISKALEVEADDFSLAAVKMIILAGGNVYRKRNDED